MSSVRLVDRFDQAEVTGTPPLTPAAPTLWSFDAPGADLQGWHAVAGVDGVAVRGGRLTGRSTGELPVLLLDLDPAVAASHGDDLLHSVQVRLRASGGANLSVGFVDAPELDLQQALGPFAIFPWGASPIVPGDEPGTYTLNGLIPERASGMRHILLRPTDAAGVDFEIESIRLIFRREHLAEIPSGISWQGLGEIYRETVVTRAPEIASFHVEVPAGAARLELAVGTPEDDPVTFELSVAGGPRLVHTVTTPDRWEPLAIELAEVGGRAVDLELALHSPKAGAIGFWGAPAVRHLVSRAPEHDGRRAPRGVILVMVDTLRADHLDAWGYSRETAPQVTALAQTGARFADCNSQATWTKVSSPALLTSLYPSTHGVQEFTDRLPAAATTLAEVFRDAGYATLSFSSVMFTGKFSNMQQGFEVLHEATSTPDPDSSKTARVYVDRLLPWLGEHRDVPFFVYLHLFDPHDPYEPHRPYDTLFFDPSVRAEHEHEIERVRDSIEDPLLKAFLMPSRAQLEEAGIDADRFVHRQIDWYDGSIRGFDAELGRLREGLRQLGLEQDTLLVFLSDHGEEFLEHGRSFHGQSVYGELTHVPLVFSWPGVIPPDRVIDGTVQLVDVMPTILELNGLPVPEAAQGHSLVPLLTGTAAASPPAPAFAEHPWTKDVASGAPPPDGRESFAIIADGYRLIHNTRGWTDRPEYELFDHVADPLDQHDLASRQPEVASRLAKLLRAWREQALAAKLEPDADTAGLSAAELERLRSLGYIQ